MPNGAKKVVVLPYFLSAEDIHADVQIVKP
jgi:hypothetical protein